MLSAAPSAADERFTFVAEWNDKAAQIIKRMNVVYYPSNTSVELIDVKLKRKALARTVIPSLTLNQMRIGASITIFGKQLVLLDYLDESTRAKLGVIQEKVCAVILDGAYPVLGRIFAEVAGAGFIISNALLRRFTLEQAQHLVQHMQLPNAAEVTEQCARGLVCVLEMVGADACNRWRELSRSFVRSYGNFFAGSFNSVLAVQEFAFVRMLPTTATMDNCTLCIIKPHLVVAGRIGEVLDVIIGEGYDVSAMQMFNLDRTTANDFLEVYRDVLPDFHAMAEELSSGPCLALEVRQEDAVRRFRDLCGPMDPEMARVLRPRSIRAQFGNDTAKNAVHCTDLEEDGQLEVEFFFAILQK